MSNDKRFHVSGVDEKLKNEVEQLAKENKMSISSFVVQALRYYIEHEGRDYHELEDVLTESFTPLINELYIMKKIMRKLDKDSIVYKEYINHSLATNKNGKTLVTTEISYTDELQEFEELANRKVSKMRQNKLSN